MESPDIKIRDLTPSGCFLSGASGFSALMFDSNTSSSRHLYLTIFQK